MPFSIDGIKKSIEQLKSINVGALLGRAFTVIAENQVPTVIAGTLILTSSVSVVITVSVIATVIFYASKNTQASNLSVKGFVYKDSFDQRELWERMMGINAGIFVGFTLNPPPIFTAVIALATAVFYAYLSFNPTTVPSHEKLVKPKNLTHIFPNENIVTDAVLLIFKKFKYKDLIRLSQVSRRWKQLVNDPYLTKEAVFQDFVFNPLHWNTVFPEVICDEAEVKRAIQSLPTNISEILKSSSKGFRGERIMDKHILTWIPTYNNKELTINIFGNLLKQKEEFSHNLEGYKTIHPYIVTQLGNKAIDSGWFFFATENLPKNPIEFQIWKSPIEFLNGNGQTEWKISELGVAIISIYAHYFKSGKKLFSDISTTCKNSDRNELTAAVTTAGPFEASGLVVNWIASFDFNVDQSLLKSVAPSWRLKAPTF